MLKKVIICSVVSMFLLCGTVIFSLATGDTGPEKITIVDNNSKHPKPAQFPHKKHQESYKCAECHHGIADGKQVPYVEGQEIKKCETCHNSEVLAGKMDGKLKLDTLKGAGHGKCLACHKEMAKKDPALKEITKCKNCHS